jgi:hypothetical protein
MGSWKNLLIMSKLAVAVFSRNNYKMFRGFTMSALFDRVPSHILKLNIDDKSNEDQKALGKRVCKEGGVTYIGNRGRGIQWCVETASRYLAMKYNIGWLIVFQSDAYPISADFWSELEKELSSGRYDNVGTIGFNVAADDCGCDIGKTIESLYAAERPMLVLGRCPLVRTPPIHWYRPSDLDMSSWKREPFLVEIPNWQVIGLNLRLFDEVIGVTNKYHMHFAWDDIAMQFLRADIPNMAIPTLYCAHQQSAKGMFGLIKHSVTAIKEAWVGGSQGRDLMGTANHIEVWKKRWGWDYTDKNSFAASHGYKSELMCRFRNHNLLEGPLPA